MNYSEQIKNSIGKIATKGYYANAYKSPEISDKILNNCIKSIAPDLIPEYIIAVLDQSLLKNGKEGIVFSGDAIYWKSSFEEYHKVLYEDIENVISENKEKIKRNGTVAVIPSVKFILKSGSEIQLSESIASNMDTEHFIKLLNSLTSDNHESFTNEVQIVPLQEMSEEIKQAYVKVLCNYAFAGDGQIDPREYSEIISFIVRIGMDGNSRIVIRQYINELDDVTELEDLLIEIKQITNTNEFSTISKSLVKDILSIYMLENNGADWEDDNFIRTIASELEVSIDEIQIFIASIERDKEIIEGRLNDSQVTKTLKDLSARATSVGLPMAVLYFSGTTGVSAIGMTTGLSTLGMGGLLGFSSMFTGVGALALIGVTSYHGIKKITGMNDVNNNRNREILLREIIRNTQTSLTYLIEDINTITIMLADEMAKSEQNKEKIEKLASILRNASNGSKVTIKKSNYYQSENILVRVPKYIDETKIIEMTNEPTLLPLKDRILECYNLNEENKYELKENLSIEKADFLVQSFEKIGYFNITDQTTAQLKTSAKNLIETFKNM